jgi:hypothetical protein
MKKNILVVCLIIFSNYCFCQENSVESANDKEPKVVAVLSVTKDAPSIKKITAAKKSTSIKQALTRLPKNILYPQKGTYQIISSNEDLMINISPELLAEIESNRDSENVTYYIINEYAKVKILPFKTIQSENFVPLKTFNYEK